MIIEKIRYWNILLCMGFFMHGNAQHTLSEKLGFAADTKLLIIHADDLGVAHTENMASILALKIGMVTSASVMMPCSWTTEIATYAKDHPEADLGLHLTLTSEWETMKWGPVAGRGTVKTLVNNLGFFYDNCQDMAEKASLKEVETELRAQIQQAYTMGIVPTHLDTHMGCLGYTPELSEIYLKLGEEYRIPVMIDRPSLQAAPKAVKDLVMHKEMIVEQIIMAYPPNFESGMANYYESVLTEKLTPGVQVLLIHAAFDNAEMQALSTNHPLWGAKWRQDDFDFFTSTKCRKLLEKHNIQLITWRDIQRVIYGN